MDHKKWYIYMCIKLQTTVLAVCFLMKLDGIVWGVMDGLYIVFIVYTHQFNEP